MLGNNEQQINARLKELKKGLQFRNQIIENLKEKYSLSKYKEELFKKIYVIDSENDRIFVEVNYSHFIKVYKNDDSDFASFEPLTENSINEVQEYIDSLIKNIKI